MLSSKTNKSSSHHNFPEWAVVVEMWDKQVDALQFGYDAAEEQVRLHFLILYEKSLLILSIMERGICW